MDKTVVYTLCALLIILGIAFGVLAIANGVEPAIVIGLITTVLGVLVPSPLVSGKGTNWQ